MYNLPRLDCLFRLNKPPSLILTNSPSLEVVFVQPHHRHLKIHMSEV